MSYTLQELKDNPPTLNGVAVPLVGKSPLEAAAAFVAAQTPVKLTKTRTKQVLTKLTTASRLLGEAGISIDEMTHGKTGTLAATLASEIEALSHAATGAAAAAVTVEGVLYELENQ